MIWPFKQKTAQERILVLRSKLEAATARRDTLSKLLNGDFSFPARYADELLNLHEYIAELQLRIKQIPDAEMR